MVEHGEQKLTQVKHYGYTIELQEGLQVIYLVHVCTQCVYAYNCTMQALLSNPSVTRKWLSLTELNHAIQAHHYGYTECDTKPNKINRGQTIDADFRIKSSGNLK